MNKKLQQTAIQCASIDSNNYTVALAYAQPEPFLQVYSFEDEDKTHLAQSTVFNTAITGLLCLGTIANKDLIVVGTMGGTIHLWDKKQQKSYAKLSGHLTAPSVFAYDSASQFLISGAEDTNIKIWDLRTGSRGCLTTFTEHQGII